jgi:signal transduction histidine kinase
MEKPFVDALRQARDLVSSAPTADAVEAAAARKVGRNIDEAIARCEGGPDGTDIISIVCHDLKDPLASIVMGNGFLQKVASKDEAMRRVVNAISRSTDRLARVISDFHDLAKLDAGRIVVDLHPCDVCAALAGKLDELAREAHGRDVQFAFERAPGSAVALCDRARLIQIVGNLVSNAIRFTDPGGRVVVRVVAEEPEEKWIRVVVRDTGRGIPAERLPLIFDHAANAGRVSRDGPGLGLPIVKGLVELQGGDVTVTSKVGEGSSFEVALPKAP